VITEALILSAVQAIVDLLEGLEGAPTQAQIDAAIRSSLVKASDLDMQTEFAGQKP
jgi:hypothetical protein